MEKLRFQVSVSDRVTCMISWWGAGALGQAVSGATVPRLEPGGTDRIATALWKASRL